MEGARRSSRLNPNAPGNTASQDDATQSEGKSAASKEKRASKRKAESQEGSSGTELRALKIHRLDLPASLEIPSIVQNNFQEDIPMAGTSSDPAVNLLNDKGPYYVDESVFKSAYANVDSMTTTHLVEGWDTGKRLKGRSIYRLKKHYGTYWLEKLGGKKYDCEKRFEDKKDRDWDSWELECVKAVAIEHKPQLWPHRFDMKYFFEKKNWKENKNGTKVRPWALQVEVLWRNKVTKETETTWEVPSTVWRYSKSRELAEKAIFRTAEERARISREMAAANVLPEDWKTPAPDACNETQAGTGMETTSTAISDATQSPAVKIEPPSPRTRSKSPLMFTNGNNSSQHAASAQKRPQYDMSTEMENREDLLERWKAPSPDARNETPAGSGAETTLTAVEKLPMEIWQEILRLLPPLDRQSFILATKIPFLPTMAQRKSLELWAQIFDSRHHNINECLLSGKNLALIGRLNDVGNKHVKKPYLYLITLPRFWNSTMEHNNLLAPIGSKMGKLYYDKISGTRTYDCPHFTLNVDGTLEHYMPIHLPANLSEFTDNSTSVLYYDEEKPLDIPITREPDVWGKSQNILIPLKSQVIELRGGR